MFIIFVYKHKMLLSLAWSCYLVVPAHYDVDNNNDTYIEQLEGCCAALEEVSGNVSVQYKVHKSVIGIKDKRKQQKRTQCTQMCKSLN